MVHGFISSVLLFLAAGTGATSVQVNGRSLQDPLPSLADIVVNTDAFSTLEGLVIKAGLVEALSSDGPFTVLAPPDSAFAGLLTAAPTLTTNLASLDTWNVHLTDVLLYHVVSGQVMSQDLLGSELTVTMLNSQNITISVVTNIVDLGKAEGDFDIVLSLLVQTGLDVALTGYGDDSNGLTLFAPNDSAFDGVDVSSLTDEQITGILLYHVVPGVAASATLATGSVATLQGGNLDLVVADDGSVSVNGISVIFVDALASNGIVHVIDQVLIPPPIEKCPPLNPVRKSKNRTRT